MKCDYCDHEWISISPVEVRELECPECGKMSRVGDFQNTGTIDTGQPPVYWQRREVASQQALEMALRENRVRDECLEIAMEALNWYGHNCPVLLCSKAGEALDKIERRLAALEANNGDQ